MPPPLFDTHAHLFDDRFADDLPAVLDRAAAAGVERVVAVGIDAATSRASGRTGRAGSRSSWPRSASSRTTPPRPPPATGTTSSGLAEAGPPVAAVGETGLDRYWDRTPFPLQEDYFARHLELARRLELPVVIHCREAEADVVRMLRDEFDRHGPVRGVMHSFTGDRGDGRRVPGDGPARVVRRDGDVQDGGRPAGGGGGGPGRPGAGGDGLPVPGPGAGARQAERAGVRGPHGRGPGRGAGRADCCLRGTNDRECPRIVQAVWIVRLLF